MDRVLAAAINAISGTLCLAGIFIILAAVVALGFVLGAALGSFFWVAVLAVLFAIAAAWVVGVIVGW